MGVEVQMDMREIRDYLHKELEKHIHQIIAMLHYVGNTVVNQIRDSIISDWNDQSGNLRSSIGYIISLDGQPIEMSDFKPVIGPTSLPGQENGSEIGKEYALSLVHLYPNGIALIVVAGMSYASYVERMENKTVLAQGKLVAQQLVSQLIQKYEAAKSK